MDSGERVGMRGICSGSREEVGLARFEGKASQNTGPLAGSSARWDPCSPPTPHSGPGPLCIAPFLSLSLNESCICEQRQTALIAMHNELLLHMRTALSHSLNESCGCEQLPLHLHNALCSTWHASCLCKFRANRPVFRATRHAFRAVDRGR